FWLLLSLWLVTSSKSRLGRFALAAAALGIAILSEELFLIFLPVMLYAVSLYATSFQRKFSLVAFVYITLAISSVYVLLALLRSEFLPSGNPMAHPSLIGTLLLKTQAPLVDQRSSAVWQAWLQTDPLLIVAGAVAMLLNILGGTVNRIQLLAALLGVTFWVALIINNVWYPYLIVPFLPFLALNITTA